MSLLSDIAGCVFWAVTFAAFTAPMWLPVVTFFAGVWLAS